MKIKVNAATGNQNAINDARKILNKGKELLDIMEGTPSGFLDANDLGVLYEELIEVLPSLDFAINSNSVDPGNMY